MSECVIQVYHYVYNYFVFHIKYDKNCVWLTMCFFNFFILLCIIALFSRWSLIILQCINYCLQIARHIIFE